MDEFGHNAPRRQTHRDHLLQHSSVLDEAVNALEESKIDPASVDAELRLTELGERLKLSVRP